jgi:hypothetical protein
MALKTAAPAMEAKTEATVNPAQDKAQSEGKAKLATAQTRSDKRDEMFVSPAKDVPASAANSLDSSKQLVISRNTLAHGPLQSNQLQQQNAFALAKQVPTNEARTSNSPASISGGAAAAAPAPIAVDQINPAAQDSNLAWNSQSQAQLQAQRGQAESEVEKAKEPALLGPAPKTAVDSDRLGAQLRATRAVAANAPRWTINSSGGLQRSYDQGVTWQDVNVNQPALATGAAIQLYAATERAKVANAPPSAKPVTAKKDQSSPVFRTVVANGADVWVGGANAVLYHSTDAGASWTRVLPSTADAALTGDILTMEFPDPQNGKIVTSTSETWITADRGLTWRKQ